MIKNRKNKLIKYLQQLKLKSQFRIKINSKSNNRLLKNKIKLIWRKRNKLQLNQIMI